MNRVTHFIKNVVGGFFAPIMVLISLPFFCAYIGYYFWKHPSNTSNLISLEDTIRRIMEKK